MAEKMAIPEVICVSKFQIEIDGSGLGLELVAKPQEMIGISFPVN